MDARSLPVSDSDRLGGVSGLRMDDSPPVTMTGARRLGHRLLVQAAPILLRVREGPGFREGVGCWTGR